MAFFVKLFSSNTICMNNYTSTTKVGDFKIDLCDKYNLPSDEIQIIQHGRPVTNESIVETDAVYHVTLPLVGGKGGFGSMLRMLGAQIEKTTNHEACRDLSGRRMRDVNNEKKLADWLTKKTELEKQKEEKRQQKLERMRSQPKHFFVDPNYDKQRKEVLENLDDAITQGLQASATTSEECSFTAASKLPTKRKVDADVEGSSKKSCLWMGVDIDMDSDEESDLESSTIDHELKPSDEASNPDKCVNKPAETPVPPHPLLVADLPPPQCHAAQKDSSDTDQSQTSIVNEPVDLDQFASVSELETLGLERLKIALMLRGLKCGGTLQERSSRLFSVKGLTQDQIDPALLVKSSKGKKGKKAKAKN